MTPLHNIAVIKAREHLLQSSIEMVTKLIEEKNRETNPLIMEEINKDIESYERMCKSAQRGLEVAYRDSRRLAMEIQNEEEQ